MSSDQEERLKHLEEVVKGLTGEDTNILYEAWKAANQGHQHWDGSQYICDPGYVRGTDGICVLVQEPPQPPQPPTPPPIPTAGLPIPTTGVILYDGNTDGKWNDGVDRTVKGKEGNVGPNGKGFYCAASGSPQVHIDGKGVFTLITKPGFGRVYFCVNNYNAIVVTDFNIVSGSVDNWSSKWRNEHQMGGACDHRPGGLGSHIALDECGFKDEKCHNIQGKGSNQKLKKALKNNTWYRSAYAYRDEGQKVRKTRWIDYMDGNGWVMVNDLLETTFPMLMSGNKASFEQHSEGWERLNGSGEISLRNYQVIAL